MLLCDWLLCNKKVEEEQMAQSKGSTERKWADAYLRQSIEILNLNLSKASWEHRKLIKEELSTQD